MNMQTQSDLIEKQTQSDLFSRFLCFDEPGEKPQSGFGRTTGAALLDRGSDTALLVFSHSLYLDTPGVTPPAGKRRSVQEARRRPPKHPFRKDGARTPHD